MGAFIARQPNGLLCRFSTIVDAITDYNMTEEEYIELRAEMAREDARYEIQNRTKDFEYVRDNFSGYGEMKQEEFDQILKEISFPASEVLQRKIEEETRGENNES